MSKTKIAIAIAVLFIMALASITGLLYLSSTLLIKYLALDALSPSLGLVIDLAKTSEDKRIKGFATIALALSALIPLLLFGLIGYAVFAPNKRELHGSAKFASELELTKNGLLQADKPDDKYPSIIVGKHKDKFLLFRGQQFLFLSAPTRSGKGVGVVIPNLLHYRDSAVVLDIKN